MKARVPHYYTAKEKRAIRDEMYREYRKIEQEKSREMAERCLKIFLYVLNRDEGYGEKRANRFYNACGELLATANQDEVFWEHIDRVVIDELLIPDFKRDYTDKYGKAYRED